MKQAFSPAILIAVALLSVGITKVDAQSWPARPTAPSPWARQQIHPAVARIVAPGKGTTSYGSGTLVAVNEQHGLVLTNWHVVNEATGPVTVIFPDGFQSPGLVQKVDRTWDLAAVAIWRPTVEPVALSQTAPRPGDMLTIAGYGSGAYRSVSGRCTQYVAPGLRHPYEMVELAASARQGDSGGPIFNSQGELAGVLWGEGGGRTSGTYCGRVHHFIADIVPAQDQRRDAPLIVAAPLPVGPETFEPPGTNIQSQATRATQQAPTAPPRPVVTTVPPPAAPSVAYSTSNPTYPMGSAQNFTANESHYVGWTDMAGATRGEQVKTFLAVVGVLAVFLQIMRWLSG